MITIYIKTHTYQVSNNASKYPTYKSLPILFGCETSYSRINYSEISYIRIVIPPSIGIKIIL